MNKCAYCGSYTYGDNLHCHECNWMDDDFDFDEDDLDDEYWENEKEREEEERAEIAATCKCGAWVFNSKGHAVHVADCICGAQ